MKNCIFYIFCGVTGFSGFSSGIQARDPVKEEEKKEIKEEVTLWEPLLQGIDLGKILEVLRPKWESVKKRGLIKIPASTLLNQMGIPGQDKVSFMRDTRALLCQLLLAGNAEEEMIRCVSSPEELARLGVRGINIQNFKVDTDGVRRFYKANSFQLSNVYKALMVDGGLISLVAEKMKDYERFLNLESRKSILQSVVVAAAPFLKKEVFEKIPESSIDPVVHLGGYYVFENLSLDEAFKDVESAKTKYLDDHVSQITLSAPVIEKIITAVTGRNEEALENCFLEMVEPLKSDLTLREKYAVGAQFLNSILNDKFTPQARQDFYKEIIEISLQRNKISDAHKEILRRISEKEDSSFVIHHIYAQPWKEENVSIMIGLLEAVQRTQNFMEGATFDQIETIMRKQMLWPNQYIKFTPQARQDFYKEIIEISLQRNKISDAHKEILRRISEKEDSSFVIHHIYAQPWKEDNILTIMGLLEAVERTHNFVGGATFDQIVNIVRQQVGYPNQLVKFLEKDLIDGLFKWLDQVPLVMKKDDMRHIIDFSYQYFKNGINVSVGSRDLIYWEKLAQHMTVSDFMEALKKTSPQKNMFGLLLTNLFLRTVQLNQEQLEEVVQSLDTRTIKLFFLNSLMMNLLDQNVFNREMYGKLGLDHTHLEIILRNPLLTQSRFEKLLCLFDFRALSPDSVGNVAVKLLEQDTFNQEMYGKLGLDHTHLEIVLRNPLLTQSRFEKLLSFYPPIDLRSFSLFSLCDLLLKYEFNDEMSIKLGFKNIDFEKFFTAAVTVDNQKKMAAKFSQEISFQMWEKVKEKPEKDVPLGALRFLSYVPKDRLTKQGEQLCDHVVREALKKNHAALMLGNFPDIFSNLQEKIGLENLSKMIAYCQKYEPSAAALFGMSDSIKRLQENMKKIKQTYDPT